MLVEQAIYTSARTQRSEGYHLVAGSPGLHDIDARELVRWCPSHDALIDGAPFSRSINFHRLPTGAHCVSETREAGTDYSDRGGPRLLTHCLIVPPEVLAQFANNPFAVLQEAGIQGLLDIPDDVPREIGAVKLHGRASVVDRQVMDKVLAEVGPTALAALVHAAVHWESVAVAGCLPTEWLMAGLINCLPVECRTELPLATALRYSPRRPFRLVALPPRPADQRALERRYGMRGMDLAGELPAELVPMAGWGHYVAQWLANGGPASLAARLLAPRPGLVLEQLDALADELARAPVLTAATSWLTQHAHAGHGVPVASGGRASHRGNSPGQGRPAASSTDSSLPLPTGLPLDKLEELEESIGAALAGQEEGLERFLLLWPQLAADLDFDLVQESRERLLAYAVGLFERASADGASAAQATAMIDLLCAICDEW